MARCCWLGWWSAVVLLYSFWHCPAAAGQRITMRNEDMFLRSDRSTCRRLVTYHRYTCIPSPYEDNQGLASIRGWQIWKVKPCKCKQNSLHFRTT